MILRSILRPSLIVLLAFSLTTRAAARPVVSPALHDIGNGGLTEAQAISDLPGVGPVIDLFVTGSTSDAELQAHGAIIGTSLPDGTRTIKMPVSRFEELRDIEGLTRIAAAYKCKMSNNVSVGTTNATPGFWTHSGAGVFAGNAGAGVILGLVDSGIDWSHDDFKKTDGTTRILNIWDQNVAGAPPAGYAYGTEWTAAQINGGTCTHHDTNGHGSHVMGSAAGDGSGTGNAQPAYQFIGMAPKADIIVVATTFSTAAVIDGVNYIFQKAAALGKNAVVNLSLGTQFGAHDGSDTFDTSLSALTGAGKIVVASAGNEGGASLHARQAVPMGPTQTITFSVPVYTANGGAGNDFVLIDAYYPGSANMSVTLTSPGPTPVTVGPVVLGGSTTNSGSLAGSMRVDNGFSPAPGGDKNVYIEIYDAFSARPPRQGTWTITLTPVATTAGTLFDAWLPQMQLGAAGVVALFTSDVDEHVLVGSPGSALSVITVASYITKGSWPSIDGNSYSYTGLTTVGALAGYSSPGPLRNGTQKPDIAAPGSAIVSTKSIFTSPAPANALINPDGQHVTETGTSMAAPHVTGACALLLAATPNLTPAQLKTRLQTDAVVDANTGAVPNSSWGYGKLRLSSPDVTPPTVTVNAPNGGENWAIGSIHNITWTATDNIAVASITLEYSTNNGGAWNPIASGEANDGTYAWTVPNAPTTQALVRVKALDAVPNTGSDVSNAVFTISDQAVPTVTVLAPNGGESWAVGSLHNITWTAADNVGVTSITIEYSTNNGGAWVSVATGEANDGTYSWTVPNTVTNQALVRVTARDAATNAGVDQSNAVFSIVDANAPVVTVLAPNGGEVWAAGSLHNITWTATDNVAVVSVSIDYSLNNGGIYTNIASGLANSGTYGWTLPQQVSTQALVRVTAFDNAVNAGFDASNAVFTIADQTPPTVAVTSPNGGEVWNVGDAHALTWTASDLIGVTAVDLAYSNNNGGAWITIANGEANDGTYSWTVPNDATTTALVRATARDAATNSTADQSNAVFTISAPSAVNYLPAVLTRPMLLQNRPNPFNPMTWIGFGLPAPGHARLVVFSAGGRLIRTLADREFPKGYSEVMWDGRTDDGGPAPSGIYFYRLESGTTIETKRLVMSK